MASVAAPTSVKATKLSATLAELTWGGGYVHEILGRRRSVKGSTTATWNAYETISSGSTYASGTGVTVATGYEWQFAARRRSGSDWSDYGYSNVVQIWTAPATPTDVSVARSGSDMRVSWAGGVVDQVQVAVRAIRGSGTASWGDWSTAVSSAVASGVLVNVPAGVDAKARVRRTSDGMWSDWGYSGNSARMFDAPPAPTAFTVARSSDSRHDAAWSASSPANQPVLHFEIDRWRKTTGSYVTVASPGSPSRSWADTAALGDDQARWRIRAVNAAGSSAWAYSAFLSTTPAVAINVKAVRSGATNVAVSWTPKARAGDYQTIQAQSSSDGGGTWSSWASVSGHTSLGMTITSRTISGLNAAYVWRFRIVTGVNSPALTSTSAASAIVQVLAPPSAPTLLTPMQVQSSEDLTTFQWRHNPVDGSDQTAAELQYRVDGGAWIGHSTTTASEATIGPLPIGVIEWQARTKGAHASWSAWSAITTFTVAEPPAVTILSPLDGATLTTNRLTLEALYSDAQGAAMVGWTRRLRDADSGEVLEEVSGSGPAQATVFGYRLQDQTAYIAEWEAVSGTGLRSATAAVTVTAGFLLPVAPYIAADWDEPAGIVRLTVTTMPGEPPVTDDTVAHRIERFDGEAGRWVVLVDGLGLDPSWDDQTVILNTATLYRAVAITALGVEAISEPVSVETPTGRAWLVGEDGAALSLYLDLSISPQFGHSRVVEQYFGDVVPTAHYGEPRPISVSLSAVQAPGEGLDMDVRRLLGQDVFLRTPSRLAFWASIDDSGPSLPQTRGSYRQISLSLEAVAHG